MITISIQMKQKKSLLEDHCRRSNLQIDGVAKENGEFWDNCEQETNGIFMDKLKIDTDIIIERAHRTKKKQTWQDRSTANNRATSTKLEYDKTVKE